MKYSISRTTKFKKDFKLAMKRGLKVDEFTKVVEMLANDVELPEKYRDHQLTGNYEGHCECHCECHIQPDWLLIYLKTEEDLVRTGSHSALF